MNTDDMSKDDRIKKEVNRLKKMFKDMPSYTMAIVLSLIKNAAFMTITLEDLQTSINETGSISEYKNGENQFGTKKSPEIEVYNSLLKSHMGVMRQLTDLIPKPDNKPLPKEKKGESSEEPPKPDAFEEILRRGKNG